MTRPRFLRGEAECDQRHQNSDNSDERCGDMQPFGAGNAFTAHDGWTDVANRKQDRQKHASGRQRREPYKDSDQERLLHLGFRFVATALRVVD